MSVRCGFFDAVDGDRRYSAEDFNMLFKHIIGDGIVQNAPTHFEVLSVSGLSIGIAPGRAFYGGYWAESDTPQTVTVLPADPINNRWDAVMLVIDTRHEARCASIEYARGAAARNPEKTPAVTKPPVYKIPLCRWFMPAGRQVLERGNIAGCIPTETPFISPQIQPPGDVTLFSEYIAKASAVSRNEIEVLTADANKKLDDYQKRRDAILAESAKKYADLDKARILSALSDLEKRLPERKEFIFLRFPTQDSNGNDILDSSGRTISCEEKYGNVSWN